MTDIIYIGPAIMTLAMNIFVFAVVFFINREILFYQRIINRASYIANYIISWLSLVYINLSYLVYQRLNQTMNNKNNSGDDDDPSYWCYCYLHLLFFLPLYLSPQIYRLFAFYQLINLNMFFTKVYSYDTVYNNFIISKFSSRNLSQGHHNYIQHQSSSIQKTPSHQYDHYNTNGINDFDFISESNSFHYDKGIQHGYNSQTMSIQRLLRYIFCCNRSRSSKTYYHNSKSVARSDLERSIGSNNRPSTIATDPSADLIAAFTRKQFIVKCFVIFMLFALPSFFIIFTQFYWSSLDFQDMPLSGSASTNASYVCTLNRNGYAVAFAVLVYLYSWAFGFYLLIRKYGDLIALIPEIRLFLFVFLIFALSAFLVGLDNNNGQEEDFDETLLVFYLFNIAVIASFFIIGPYQYYMALKEGEHVELQPSDPLSLSIKYIKRCYKPTSSSHRGSELHNDPADMQTLLQDPAGARMFERYLVSEFCVELLKFHLQVSAFKAKWESIDDTIRKHWAFEIYQRFIDTDSPMQVNIGEDVRDSITVKMFPETEKLKDNTTAIGMLENITSTTMASILTANSNSGTNNTNSGNGSPTRNGHTPRTPSTCHFDSTIFDEADIETQRLLRIGPFTRFRRTDAYKVWCARRNGQLSSLSSAMGTIRRMSSNIMHSLVEKKGSHTERGHLGIARSESSSKVGTSTPIKPRSSFTTFDDSPTRSTPRQKNSSLSGRDTPGSASLVSFNQSSRIYGDNIQEAEFESDDRSVHMTAQHQQKLLQQQQQQQQQPGGDIDV